MNVSTTGIEIMIRSYTEGLDAEREKLRKTARGEIQVRDLAHALAEGEKEVTRLQGVIQGLSMARREVAAQLEGYGETINVHPQTFAPIVDGDLAG